MEYLVIFGGIKNEYFIAKFFLPNLKYIKYILKFLEYYNIVTRIEYYLKN